MEMNNINLRYKGHVISVAQHVENGKETIQEIAILPDSGDMHIVRYKAVLPSLIAALQEIQDEIETNRIEHDRTDNQRHINTV